MKNQRMSLASIKNVLSRAEMRKIMAGSGSGCYGITCSCADDPCCYGTPSQCGNIPQCCGGLMCWADNGLHPYGLCQWRFYKIWD